MRKKDRPPVADPFVKPNLALGRFGREIRRFIANS